MVATCIKSRVISQWLFNLMFFITLISCQQNTPTPTQLGYIGEMKLPGSRWILQSSKGRTTMENTGITLEFLDSNQLSGEDGCNFYGTNFTLHPKNRIQWEAGGSRTQMGCDWQRTTQSMIYFGELAQAAHYNIENTTLSLSNEKGEILLQFELLPKTGTNHGNLIYRTWHTANVPGFESKVFTLRFDSYQAGVISFHGTTPCRSYKGTYQIIDDGLGVLRYTGVTIDYFDFFCSKEDLLAEKNYIDFLKNVRKFEARMGSMALYADHGKKLGFGLRP